jgi:RNA polymerase sigma factor (sigma-70 family)
VVDLVRQEEWAALLRAGLAGDAAAHGRFLRAVTPHLRAVAARRCRMAGAPDNEVEDVVQEVLLAIHLKRETWDPARPLAPWLAAIARNKTIDALRRRGRRIVVPIEDVVETLAAPEAEETLPAREMEMLLSGLNTTQRDIVQSIALRDAGISETAARLSMSEGAVRVALHRALKALAARYRSLAT